MAGIPYQGMLAASLGMQSRQQLNHGLRSSIFKHVLCGWNQAGMKMAFSLSLYMCMSIWIMCIHTHISFCSIKKQAWNTAKSLGWITSTEDTEAQRNLVRPSLWAHHQACCAPFRPSSSGLHSLFGSQVVVVMLGVTKSYKSTVGAKKPHSCVVTPTGQIDADLCWRRQSSFGCIL